jgi:hypothetical protein
MLDFPTQSAEEKPVVSGCRVIPESLIRIESLGDFSDFDFLTARGVRR